jgi:hypothetical protein
MPPDYHVKGHTQPDPSGRHIASITTSCIDCPNLHEVVTSNVISEPVFRTKIAKSLTFEYSLR